MKNLLTSFNILISVFFGLFCFVTGVLMKAPGDGVAVHYSLLFFFFTMVLVILKLMTKTVQKDYQDNVECYEAQIKTQGKQLIRWQNGEMN